MVRIHPDPPPQSIASHESGKANGAVAQLGERLLCKQEVIGSIPFTSTSFGRCSSLGTVDNPVENTEPSVKRLVLVF